MSSLLVKVSPIPTIINLKDNLSHQIYLLRYHATSTITGKYDLAAMLTQHNKHSYSKSPN